MKSELGMNNMSARQFVAKAGEMGLPPITGEELLRPEIGIVAGMRWSLMVKPAWRGLPGAQAVMLDARKDDKVYQSRTSEMLRKAEKWLKIEAPLCDAQFLYTESQMMWAALLGGDRELVEGWLKPRVPEEVWEAINECCEVFVEGKRVFERPEGAEVELVIRYGRKVEGETNISAKEADKAVQLAVKEIEEREKEKRAREKEEAAKKEAAKREAKKKREEDRMRADDVFGGAL